MFEIIFLLNIVFIAGACLGSFIGVIVDRLYREEQFINGSSYCEKCKKKLKWNDMLPVISFLMLKGKCRYCKTPLPISLPIIELVTGFLFAVIFYTSFVNLNDQLIFTADAFYKFIYLIILFAILEIVFFMDAKYMVIPMIPLYIALGVYLLYGTFTQSLFVNWEYSLYGGLVMAGFFAAVHYLSKGQMMGDGDIYLAGFLGLILGLDLALVMWLLAFIFGAFYGIYLIVSKGAGLKQQIPFGPFLLFGFVLSYSIGSILLNLYYSFFV